MIELDDCGREVHLSFVGRYLVSYEAYKTVSMIIKAPRGTMVLFHREPYQGVGYKSFPKQTKQCQAIKRFMKEHKND